MVVMYVTLESQTSIFQIRIRENYLLAVFRDRLCFFCPGWRKFNKSQKVYRRGGLASTNIPIFSTMEKTPRELWGG